MMKILCPLLLLCSFTPLLAAQAPPLQALPSVLPNNILRLEGTDPESGIHYLRLILLLRPSEAPPDALSETLPRFTMECREQAGRRSLHWLVRFDGSPDYSFQAPIVATAKRPFPPQNPSLDLKMRFEGYMRSQEFKRQWELLPTGELHYRNSGLHSPNLDDPRNFQQWLTSLPNLRIGYAKPQPGQPRELIFLTQHLLELVKDSPLCQP